MRANNRSGEAERITRGMAKYPALLTEIKCAPKELYCIGNVELLGKRCVAVVGSRTTTGYGRTAAVNMAKRLAEAGVVVVSGMARGIDTCAHRGALKADGKTIAVLGCGPDVCYPAENAGLKAEIEGSGLIVSEYPPGTEPRSYFFPQRNRIISGLSELTVIIQARNNSGALITAECAAEQGREVCAVPGNVDSRCNLGSNKLIRDGVCPVLGPADVLEIMGIAPVDERRVEESLGGMEREVFSALCSRGEMSLDEMCDALSRPASYLSGIVAVMEMKGIVFSDMGKIFIAKD